MSNPAPFDIAAWERLSVPLEKLPGVLPGRKSALDLTTFGGDVSPSIVDEELLREVMPNASPIRLDGSVDPRAFLEMQTRVDKIELGMISLKAEIQKCNQKMAILLAKEN